MPALDRRHPYQLKVPYYHTYRAPVLPETSFVRDPQSQVVAGPEPVLLTEPAPVGAAPRPAVLSWGFLKAGFEQAAQIIYKLYKIQRRPNGLCAMFLLVFF